MFPWLFRWAQVIVQAKPGFVLVQGDTLSSFIGAIAAFYNKVDLVHIEAGLRTNRLQSPWPEDIKSDFTNTLASSCTVTP